MKKLILLLTLIMTLAACGGGDAATTAAPVATDAPATTNAPATTAAPGGEVEVVVASTDLGDIITDAEGRSLYMFVPDAQGAPTCSGECADKWPALVGEASAGAGVDVSLLGTVPAIAGGDQVIYNDWPLYYFAGDAAAGDINGQGLGDVWYVVSPDGEPIKGSAAAAADVGLVVASTDLGDIITDAEGRTLYMFKPDAQGAPTCSGGCADNWPAYTGDASAGADVDASLLGTVPALAGGDQVTYNSWPLYYFAGDAAPGEINGQGKGEVWYVIGADGEPITG